MGHHRVVLRVAREREDELLARLWQAGTLGVESRDDGDEIRVEAFFDGPPPPAIAAAGSREIERGELPAADWLAVWRAGARPLEVGARFLLDPREVGEEPPEAGGRILLRVPARAAFGTGSHESTRLVLELMEEVDFAGARVLDVGTGSGVLALAALALGARQAVGFDVDLVAPLLAAQNSALNGLRPLYFAGSAAAIGPAARFDVALVNVIPEEIRDELAALGTRLEPGGAAIFSGILAERGAVAVAALGRAGFAPRRERTAGEWVAYLCAVGDA